MEDYVLRIENKEGDSFTLEREILEEINFPKQLPKGGERIFIKDSPTLIEYYKSRVSPVEEMQKRFSNRTYIIKWINFEEKTYITAIEI
jgi:hypothetical protein